MFISFFQDIVKSEERQRLARERREEKAKYLGKYNKNKGLNTNPLHSKRAPPSVGVREVVNPCVNIKDKCSLFRKKRTRFYQTQVTVNHSCIFCVTCSSYYLV